MRSATPIIDPRRLGAMMEAFAAFGGTADGGMHRLALSAEDGAARDALTGWMRDAGLAVTVDPMGNIFGLLDLAGPDAPIVMTGSHLDSQPHGGRVGPAVHEFLAHEGIEIADFITDRRACTHADFQDDALCRSALDAYRRLHGAGPLSLTKTVFDMIDEHLDQVRTLDGWLPDDFETLRARSIEARAALEASGLDLVPCFNDPMAGNFLVDAAGTIMLIDYEYASNNDRCYDLGIWFGEMFFEESKELMMIEHYFGRADPSIVARVNLHKALADMKWSLWSMVQQRVSTIPFDFFKYGVWKLMRLRTVVEDERWPMWLENA